MNVRSSLLLFILFATMCLSFMVNAKIFTQESMLEKKLITDIASFWETGHFSSFQGKDNTRINYAAFIFKKNAECLIIAPGRSESYLKYQEVAFDLAQLGLNIFIIDHRGQGLSERLQENPHKGYVNEFDDYADDLHTFIGVTKSHCATEKQPLVLAHSMGGAITVRLLQKYPGSVKSALLASPMIAINKGGLPDWLAKTLIYSGSFINQLFTDQSWYFFGQSDYKATPFEKNSLTQSAIRYQVFKQLYKNTPDVQLGGVTIQWLKQALLAQARMFTDISQIQDSVIILQAENDSVVNNKIQTTFCQKLHQLSPNLCQQGSPYIIDDAKHELLFEKDEIRNKALTFIAEWVDLQTR